jgi:hypothetical protein
MQQTLFFEQTRPLPQSIVCHIPADDRITNVDFDNINSYDLPDLQNLADEYYDKVSQAKTKEEKRTLRKLYNTIAEAANKKAGYKMYLLIH